jgi:hypothetical protein
MQDPSRSSRGLRLARCWMPVAEVEFSASRGLRKSVKASRMHFMGHRIELAYSPLPMTCRLGSHYRPSLGRCTRLCRARRISRVHLGEWGVHKIRLPCICHASVNTALSELCNTVKVVNYLSTIGRDAVTFHFISRSFLNSSHSFPLLRSLNVCKIQTMCLCPNPHHYPTLFLSFILLTILSFILRLTLSSFLRRSCICDLRYVCLRFLSTCFRGFWSLQHYVYKQIPGIRYSA